MEDLFQLFGSDTKIYNHFYYKFKTTSVKHLPEIKNFIDKLHTEKKLSSNEKFQSYIENKDFSIPKTIPDAKYIIILAVFTKIAQVTFTWKGRKIDVTIPPEYYDDGMTENDLNHILHDQIIQNSNYQIEPASNVLLKSLCVRSGLGKYGRNNITYVGPMGSFVYLHAFYTNYEFPEDHWVDMQLMDSCANCHICQSVCPSNVISADKFVLDIHKCITLYNEVNGDFPDWTSKKNHNSLMGCIKCQKYCPANKLVIEIVEKLGEICEEESSVLFNDNNDEKLIESLAKKLRMFSSKSASRVLPILRRNLNVLINDIN